MTAGSGKEILGLSTPIPSNPTQAALQWVAPVQGTAKLNTDTSFLLDSGQGWAGAIARDCRGFVFLWKCRQLPNSSSVEEAEARAALIGLQALGNVFRGPVELELDCKTVVDCLNSDGTCLAPYYGVIQDIKAALAGFASAKVSHTGRSSNTLAHELAVEARQRGDTLIIAGVPERLRSLMMSECSLST